MNDPVANALRFADRLEADIANADALHVVVLAREVRRLQDKLARVKAIAERPIPRIEVR